MQPDIVDAEQRLVARANACKLLAQALEQPASWDRQLAEGFRQQFQALGPEVARLAQQVGAEMESALSGLEAVEIAFARLFLGPFELDAPPYASLYLDPERRLMGAASLAAAEAFAEAGLGPGDGPRDAPDHVTRELEFMYYLAFQEAQTGDAIWGQRARRFWSSHLGVWLPEFSERIAAASAHPFYDALAALLSRFVREDRV